MDWDKLRVFQVVAEAGSFTHAGETLNLSQSAVSRQVGGLEESLKVPLFHRHARGLILTEQGEVLYRAAQEVFNKLTMAEARLRDSRERPQGPLKITTTVGFGSVWLTSRIIEFLNLYPDIDVSLVLADNELNLSMREADVAIRMNPPRQPDLVQRRLMTLRYHVYAAPEYLKNHGMPKSLEDLDHHRIVVYGEQAHPPAPNLNWLLEAGGESSGKRRAVLRVNSTYAIFRAVQSGVGIGGLPAYMSEEAGNLVEILPELRGPSYNAYFVYPEELRDCKRIAVFRDFLIGKIKNRSE
ncbi:MAG: LysR family transcriptional regulator [Rhodospirillales bacterium]|jgi:DNA-binding transcriptional LysR family regulator|nr:LysR family transcriptional regulator [Rhodospirillales bacterium]HIJ43607.1 LysR family transcriptional regulator [Rhodospirillaceae bacterium]MDP7215927.1 LysR family transcriptional regulator [Rhodospirillales bacterium]HIJ45808.1 LysR family transcriptional regulator [Rhodospirillaceae bacterium]HIJ93962.1 LysR family transcriptional regulator [Rhodospirillaceae bacterium]